MSLLEWRVYMRICKQCNSEMIEGFNVKMDGAGYGIKIVKTDEVIIPKSIGKTKACICPKCGEVSLYIENLEKLKKYIGK